MTEKANKYYKLYVQWTGSDLAHRLDDAGSRLRAFADQIEEDDTPASGMSCSMSYVLQHFVCFAACGIFTYLQAQLSRTMYCWLFRSFLVADADAGAFNFSHISALPPDVLTAPTPMVLLATPGMLHGGLALKALKLWAEGPENLVLLPGFCVRGTIGAMLIDGISLPTSVLLSRRHQVKCIIPMRQLHQASAEKATDKASLFMLASIFAVCRRCRTTGYSRGRADKAQGLVQNPVHVVFSTCRYHGDSTACSALAAQGRDAGSWGEGGNA